MFHQDEESSEDNPVVRSCNAREGQEVKCYEKVFLRAVPVVVSTSRGEKEVLAFIDEGSETSFIESSLAAEIKAEGEKSPFKMSTLTSSKDFPDSRNVHVCVGSVEKSSLRHSVHVRTVDELPVGVITQDAEVLKNCKYLKDVPIPSFSEKPRILIGSRDIRLIVPIEVREGKYYQPIAMRCKLGWTMGGPVPQICNLPQELIDQWWKEDDREDSNGGKIITGAKENSASSVKSESVVCSSRQSCWNSRRSLPSSSKPQLSSSRSSNRSCRIPQISRSSSSQRTCWNPRTSSYGGKNPMDSGQQCRSVEVPSRREEYWWRKRPDKMKS